MEKNQELLIAGPGSPISLKKFLLQHQNSSPITFLIDGSGCGIAKDDKGCFYITPEDCTQQALYYAKNVFDGRRIPAYLFRYIGYMMFNDETYSTDQDVANAFLNGKLTEESEEYLRIKNFLTYIEHNTERLQVLGLIQLIGGTLNMARKLKKGINVYIDRPETALYPERQSRFVNMFMKLRDEYGYKELVQPTHDVDGD